MILMIFHLGRDEVSLVEDAVIEEMGCGGMLLVILGDDDSWTLDISRHTRRGFQ